MTPGDISSAFERNRTGVFPSRYGYGRETRLHCRDSLDSVPSKKPRLTEPRRKRSRGPRRNPATLFASSVYVPLMVGSEQERGTAGRIRDGNPSRNTLGLDQSRTRTKGGIRDRKSMRWSVRKGGTLGYFLFRSISLKSWVGTACDRRASNRATARIRSQ